MNSLDLHGIRHHEVEVMVENFIFLNQDEIPLTIVCGNSMNMVALVEKVVKRIGCEFAMPVYGKIIVRKL